MVALEAIDVNHLGGARLEALASEMEFDNPL